VQPQAVVARRAEKPDERDEGARDGEASGDETNSLESDESRQPKIPAQHEAGKDERRKMPECDDPERQTPRPARRANPLRCGDVPIRLPTPKNTPHGEGGDKDQCGTVWSHTKKQLIAHRATFVSLRRNAFSAKDSCSVSNVWVEVSLARGRARGKQPLARRVVIPFSW